MIVKSAVALAVATEGVPSGTPATISPTPLKLTSLVGDLGLEAEAELTEILAILEKVPGHMACLSMFDKDATVPEWEKKVGNSFVYHHVSHGNLVFRYYDPRVLRPYLPTCTETELDFVFGPVQRFLVEAEGGAAAVAYHREGGHLVTDNLSVVRRESFIESYLRREGMHGGNEK